MTTPQPPSSDDPFPDIEDSTLCEREDSDEALPTPQHRNAQSMSTQPPVRDTDRASRRLSGLPAKSTTQNMLQLACKRKRLSSSGTKQQLADRLAALGIGLAVDVVMLAKEFEEHGADGAVQANAKSKAPNWTCHEAARLCHIIADPRHATALGRLYNKADNRAEIDRGRNDPWSAEFFDLFNDQTYNPDVPEARDGVTEGLLLDFDPTLHPHKRNGTFLKARWNKMRSKYTIAREKYTKSGQGESDVFDTFTDGDDSIAYMHCVFYGLPALEAIVRALPEGCGAEAGLNEIDEARASVQDSRSSKRRKTNANDDVLSGLNEVARAMSAPMEISINQKKEGNVTGNFDEYDISDRVAGTVNKLMELEATIRAGIRKAVLDMDEEYAGELRERLFMIQKRIDRALAD